jgi:hypothetical protein
VKGGVEKNSRYPGVGKKSAKKGFEKFPSAVENPKPSTVSCGPGPGKTKSSTAKGSFPGIAVPGD